MLDAELPIAGASLTCRTTIRSRAGFQHPPNLTASKTHILVLTNQEHMTPFTRLIVPCSTTNTLSRIAFGTPWSDKLSGGLQHSTVSRDEMCSISDTIGRFTRSKT